MKKTVIVLLGSISVFLLVFSVYRKLTGNDPLTLRSFLSYLNCLDYDFSTTKEIIGFVSDSFNSAFVDVEIYDVITFFLWLGDFFSVLTAPIVCLGTIVADFAALLLSIVKMFFGMLGLVF